MGLSTAPAVADHLIVLVYYIEDFVRHGNMLIRQNVDTLKRQTPSLEQGTHGGCNGANTELPNAIKMSVSRNFGKTWSKPITVAKPAGERVYWPWIAAGKSGRVSVVWYQTNKVVDLDCTAAKTSVYEASLFRATKRHPTAQIVNAAGRPIHTNFVCQGGTSCVATGQDRRLGDYFTNWIDARGCVVIASGATTYADAVTGGEKAWSTPIFLHQDGGKSLTGHAAAVTALRQ